MRLFARLISTILLLGGMLSLDGMLYAQTLSDVLLILGIFVAITGALISITFGYRANNRFQLAITEEIKDDAKIIIS